MDLGNNCNSDWCLDLFLTWRSADTSLNEINPTHIRQLEDHPPSTHTKLHDCIL